jgi:CheY-like chemotaxis protein
MQASPSILVVDDSPFAARALAHVLEARGLRVRAASSMEEVVRLCAESPPAVLVTDVCMPNIDLVGLCRSVRVAAKGQRTAVLLFSAHSQAEVASQIAAAGADAFIEKRHGAAAVAARVEALCAALASNRSRHPLPSSPG